LLKEPRLSIGRTDIPVCRSTESESPGLLIVS